MSSAEVSVDLNVLIPPDTLISEAEALALAKTDPAGFEPCSDQVGGVTIHAGEVKLQLVDTMLWLIPRLCFDAIAQMLETGAGGSDFWSSEGDIRFRQKGESVEISGMYEEPENLPATAFVTAMMEAGRRYIDLVEKLWPEESKEIVAELQDRAAVAQALIDKQSQ